MNKTVTMVIRILLGVFLAFFGVNKFANFMQPEMAPGPMVDLMMILGGAGYLKMIGLIEVVGGLALIFNKYVPLALTFIVAVMFNATVFHLLFEPASVVGALVALILALVLVYANKDRFSGLFSA